MIRSNEAIFDLNDFRCPGGWRVPVGDYRPYRRIIARAGAVRVTLGPYRDPCDMDGPSRPPVYFMKVRQDRPYALVLDTRPGFRFETPSPTAKVKAGQELRIAAIVYDSAKDLQVFNLEDTLRSETIQMPGGKPYRRFASLDPGVVITDSSKTVVAQGKMPFG